MAVLTAISSSTSQLHRLLRCIGFANKALVQISEDGIRFSVEEARAMQGLILLSKDLFTTYHYTPESPPTDDDNEEDVEPPYFQIVLPALLETLQIFGFSEGKGPSVGHESGYSSGINGAHSRSAYGMRAAFDSRTLGMSSICRLSYAGSGEKLCITMEEGNVTTTCSLNTFEPDMHANEDIPFNRDQLTLKVIMRASLLYDAMQELASTSPDSLTMLASQNAPNLSLSAEGPHGSADVGFSKDTQLLETFQVQSKTVNRYKFTFMQSAVKAMAMAAKVSIRGDDQGVLSLQFMIEMDGGGLNFVDFRFVPLLGDEADAAGESSTAEVE